VFLNGRFLLQTNSICIISMSKPWWCRHRCPKEVAPNDRLFLQRLVGPSNSGCVAHERHADDESSLWLPRLQSAVRAVRSHDPADHGSAEEPLFGRLFLLPARLGK
jgi:hypothetical protein